MFNNNTQQIVNNNSIININSLNSSESENKKILGATSNKSNRNLSRSNLTIATKMSSSAAGRSKKTKGRVKIKMEFIENKSRRYTTFSKRKTGIMKKAYELSTLTGTQVMLLVASETGHVYTFATEKLQPMITSDEGQKLIQKCLSPNGGNGSGAGSINGGLSSQDDDNHTNKISIENFNNDELYDDLDDDDFDDDEDEEEDDEVGYVNGEDLNYHDEEEKNNFNASEYEDFISNNSQEERNDLVCNENIANNNLSNDANSFNSKNKKVN
jgi:hypothetical protein